MVAPEDPHEAEAWLARWIASRLALVGLVAWAGLAWPEPELPDGWTLLGPGCHVEAMVFPSDRRPLPDRLRVGSP